MVKRGIYTPCWTEVILKRAERRWAAGANLHEWPSSERINYCFAPPIAGFCCREPTIPYLQNPLKGEVKGRKLALTNKLVELHKYGGTIFVQNHNLICNWVRFPPLTWTIRKVGVSTAKTGNGSIWKPVPLITGWSFRKPGVVRSRTFFTWGIMLV